MPAAEVAIDRGVVRRLLAAQFPEWSALPVEWLTEGWDNAIFRLGAEFVVRLPRRQVAADLVAKEQRWLPELAGRLPLAIPAPIGRGVAGEGYPWPWSVCPWLPGDMAAVAPPGDLAEAAATLGRFVAALARPAPPGGPRNELRGVPLAARDDRTRADIAAADGLIDAAAVTAAWEEALRVPPWAGAPRWIHGDLHPANILVADGRLRAVIDFGDLAVGDPATDLMSAWMMLPAVHRPVFRAEAGADDDSWARGRGWALSVGVACVAHSSDNPVLAAIGLRTVRAVLADLP